MLIELNDKQVELISLGLRRVYDETLEDYEQSIGNLKEEFWQQLKDLNNLHTEIKGYNIG